MSVCSQKANKQTNKKMLLLGVGAFCLLLLAVVSRWPGLAAYL